MKNKWNLVCKILIVVIAISGLILLNEKGADGAGGKVIYTSATKSASDNSGDGTKNNPYNLFETALANASDGDTIYILAPKGFVNASDNSPLIINKKITIKGDNTVFMVRKSGIVLGADVTFENVVLSFGSRYHDGIFANGHSLTLKNVSCEDGARKVDIFGGGLYINGVSVLASGNASTITIEGAGANFGNIYAGSLNGDFAGSVTINLTGLNSARNTNVYISGADEPYVNLDDLFNLTEPPAPTVNKAHTISGKVNITAKDCNISLIEQADKSQTAESTVTIDTNGKYWGAIAVKGFDKLIVKGGGTFAPTGCSSEISTTLTGGSCLDMSNISTPVLSQLISENSNQNKLILGKNHFLTVTKDITGSFVFETENGYNNHSGSAQYDYAYIRLANTGNTTSGTFSYSCIPGMEMTLDRTNNYTSSDTQSTYKTVWKTSEATEYSPFPIKGLEITNPSITVTKSEFSNSVIYNAVVSVSTQQAQNDCYFDLVPIQYRVKYMGVEYIGTAQFDGYGYYADIPALGMSFMALSDYDLSGATINVYTYMDGSSNAPKQPDTGVYTITILPFSEGTQIEKVVKLIITDENGNYPSEPETQAPTTTEPTTAKPQEPSSEKPTAKPQEPSSEKPTAKPQEPSSEKPTAKPQKPSSEKPSATESQTDKPSEEITNDEVVSGEITSNEGTTSQTSTSNETTDSSKNSEEEPSAQESVEESLGVKQENDKTKFPKAIIYVIVAVTALALGLGGVFVIRNMRNKQ